VSRRFSSRSANPWSISATVSFDWGIWSPTRGCRVESPVRKVRHLSRFRMGANLRFGQPSTSRLLGPPVCSD
jgi:hypothetical protein